MGLKMNENNKLNKQTGLTVSTLASQMDNAKGKLKETATQRKRRLEKRRKKHQEKLANETEEEKRLRLDKRNQRLRDASQEQHEARLLADRQRHALSITNETQKQRELRLQDLRRRQALTIANETQEQRATRLQDLRRRQALKIANETKEQREARLLADRQRHALSRTNNITMPKKKRTLFNPARLKRGKRQFQAILKNTGFQGNSSGVKIEDQIPVIKSEVPDNPESLLLDHNSECVSSDIHAQDQQVQESIDNLLNYPNPPLRNINNCEQGTDNSVTVKTKLIETESREAISVKKRPIKLRYTRSKKTQTKTSNFKPKLSNFETKPSYFKTKPSNFRTKPKIVPVPGPIDMDPNDLIKRKAQLQIKLAIGNEIFLSNNVHSKTTLGSSSSSYKNSKISNCTIHSDKMACAIDNCLGIRIKTEEDDEETISLPGYTDDWYTDDLDAKPAKRIKQEKDLTTASFACGSSKWKGPVVNNYSRANRINMQQQPSNSSSDISASYVISSCKKEIETSEEYPQPMVSNQVRRNASGTGVSSPQSSGMDSDNDYDDPKVDPDFILAESPPSSEMDSDIDDDGPEIDPDLVVAEYGTETGDADHESYSDFENIENEDNKDNESNHVQDLDFSNVRDAGDAEDITESILNQDESVSKYLSDPDFYFFVGLMPFLKKLSAADRVRARSSIQRVIFDMLEFSKKS